MKKENGKEKKRKEIHTCVTRGRDVSLGIREFTMWCEFYCMKKNICYRKRVYIIEREDKNKEKPITYKKNYLCNYIFFFLIKLYLW